MNYIRKYGVIMKGTLIINEKKKIDKISKSIIQNSIEDIVKTL